MADAERSRVARAASERALVRVVHHYGARPEFVVLGGLVPELLCAASGWRHAGTTDVDVQVDLEVACGAVNTARLENALRNAEFEPDTEQVWRWVADGTDVKTVVKFELLADLDTEPNQATVRFDACDNLGAVNLRGTGFASRDPVVQQLTAKIGGDLLTVEVNVSGLAGFLLAKSAAARSRRLAKDWYDVVFVLLHNDVGGAASAANAVRARFEPDLVGAVRTALDDLLANFTNPGDQGPVAYAEQMLTDHPELDAATVAADAVLAVEAFHRRLFDPA
ncbi:MAG: hypothetical protein ACT4PW_11650 [Acidimicrobiia bacterium]